MTFATDLNQFVTQHPVIVSALGLSFVITLLSSVAVIGALRHFISSLYRLAFILLVTATIVTILDRVMQAWLFELRLTLGMYVPLMAMNALLLCMLEEVALRRSLPQSLKQAAAAGMAVFAILAAAGLIRGSLGQGGELVFAVGLPIMETAAGAFLVLGCLIAAIRFLALPGTASQRE